MNILLGPAKPGQSNPDRKSQAGVCCADAFPAVPHAVAGFAAPQGRCRCHIMGRHGQVLAVSPQLFRFADPQRHLI
eukprot:gene17617-biopygen17347